MNQDIIVSIVALIAGALAVIFSLFSTFKIKGKFKTAQGWLVIGLVFIYLAMISLFLQDYYNLPAELSHTLAKIFLAAGAIFTAVSAKLNNSLYSYIPHGLLEKLRR